VDAFLLALLCYLADKKVPYGFTPSSKHPPRQRDLISV